jgi:DNA-binding NarL/FixJ family response regulator
VTVRVAVSDPLPLFEDGIVQALAAVGHEVETPGDLAVWAARERSVVVVLTVIGEVRWQLLRQLSESGTYPVVALLEPDTAVLGVRAMHAGARAVLARTVTGHSLVRTVQAVLEGQAVIPAEVAAELLIDRLQPNGPYTEQETRWLRALASGETVAQVAQAAGYSERAMFRLLKDLYRSLGVQTRLEAIIRAQKLGLLEGLDVSGAR